MIDHAVELGEANRSHFMLPSTPKETKNMLLDQSTIYVETATLQKVVNWMDAEAAQEEITGMKRIWDAKLPWQTAEPVLIFSPPAPGP